MIPARVLVAEEAAEPRQRSSAQGQRAVVAASVVVLMLLDVLIVAAVFAVSYAVRLRMADVTAAPVLSNDYFEMSQTVGLVAAVLLALQGLADVERGRSWPTRLRAITSAVSTATVIGVLLSFEADAPISRAWLAIGWSVSIAALAGWRTIAPALYLMVRRSLVTRPRAVVVGANALGQEVASELAARFEVIGYVDNGSDLGDALDRPLISAIADLESVVRSQGVDELIVALPPDRREQVTRIIARGFGRVVNVKVLQEFGEHLPRQVELGRFGARPYIGYAPVARVSWIKRALDVCLGTSAVIMLSPVIIGVAIAVKRDSAGPVFYRQRRVGRDGTTFEMLKFRSMCLGAETMVTVLREKNEASGPLFKIRNDPRITSVGRFLRRFSLDELPQLFNVLRGEMSLVGPRPPLPAEVALYEEWQLGRLQAMPGMTGLWQVSGRSEVPFNDMVRLDLHYVRNWSVGLDLEIILRTVPAVLSNHGAY
jgi:exopolysaccharide biosynthesis polyprenyl glycosylphosphotransferase